MKKILFFAFFALLLVGCKQHFTGDVVACTDTDGGNINLFGRAADHNKILYDKCGDKLQGTEQLIYEAACGPEGATYYSYVCPQGCFNGQCIV